MNVYPLARILSGVIPQGFPARFYRDAQAIMLLLLLIVLLFHDAVSGYWRYDDTFILWHALNSKGLSAFYNPSVWQQLSAANLTPWATFSFKVDLKLAGISPQFFYIHQLFSLGLVAIAAYALCRQWVSTFWAWLCVCLFLVGAPVAVVANQLMTRHYLEGMLFALLAMLAFVLALRQQRLAWAVAGALAYALATTAKEVYVPLVLLVFVIPPFNNFSLRLRLAVPYVCVAVLYVFWRQYMLGVTLGGYVETSAITGFPVVEILRSAARLPEFIFGPGWRWPTLLAAAAVVAASIANRSLFPLACALVVVVFAPLIPLFAAGLLTTADRLLFVFWFVASMTSVLAISRSATFISSNKIAQYVVGGTVCLILAAFAFNQSVAASRGFADVNREYDVHGRFIFRADARDAFVPTQLIVNNYWYVASLCDIKRRMGMACPQSLIRGLPVRSDFERLYVYDPTQKAMADISYRRNDEIARIKWVDSLRPLSVWLESNESLRWRFGPYDNGHYYIASPRYGRYHFQKSGLLRIGLSDLSFYIQYESPEGWITSSPLLHVRRGQSVDWQRTASD